MKDKIIGKLVKYKNRIKHSAENFLASKIKKYRNVNVTVFYPILIHYPVFNKEEICWYVCQNSYFLILMVTSDFICIAVGLVYNQL